MNGMKEPFGVGGSGCLAVQASLGQANGRFDVKKPTLEPRIRRNAAHHESVIWFSWGEWRKELMCASR
jgi:hypothetical protein